MVSRSKYNQYRKITPETHHLSSIPKMDIDKGHIIPKWTHDRCHVEEASDPKMNIRTGQTSILHAFG